MMLMGETKEYKEFDEIIKDHNDNHDNQVIDRAGLSALAYKDGESIAKWEMWLPKITSEKHFYTCGLYLHRMDLSKLDLSKMPDSFKQAMSARKLPPKFRDLKNGSFGDEIKHIYRNVDNLEYHHVWEIYQTGFMSAVRNFWEEHKHPMHIPPDKDLVFKNYNEGYQRGKIVSEAVLNEYPVSEDPPEFTPKLSWTDIDAINEERICDYCCDMIDLENKSKEYPLDVWHTLFCERSYDMGVERGVLNGWMNYPHKRNVERKSFLRYLNEKYQEKESDIISNPVEGIRL